MARIVLRLSSYNYYFLDLKLFQILRSERNNEVFYWAVYAAHYNMVSHIRIIFESRGCHLQRWHWLVPNVEFTRVRQVREIYTAIQRHINSFIVFWAIATVSWQLFLIFLIIITQVVLILSKFNASDFDM